FLPGGGNQTRTGGDATLQEAAAQFHPLGSAMFGCNRRLLRVDAYLDDDFTSAHRFELPSTSSLFSARPMDRKFPATQPLRVPRLGTSNAAWCKQTTPCSGDAK